MIEIIEDCQLEWDKTRGVLYVHNKKTGGTVLRIGGLDYEGGQLSEGQIDIGLGRPYWYVTYPNNQRREL